MIVPLSAYKDVTLVREYAVKKETARGLRSVLMVECTCKCGKEMNLTKVRWTGANRPARCSGCATKRNKPWWKGEKKC